jgi:hypothetical protein
MDFKYNTKINWMIIAEFYNRHMEICGTYEKSPTSKQIDHIKEIFEPVTKLKRIYVVKVKKIYLREKEELT